MSTALRTAEQQDGRAYVASIQYPGLEPFHFGTVFCPLDAKHHEIEAEIVRVFNRHCPPGFIIHGWQPGQLVFMPEKPS